MSVTKTATLRVPGASLYYEITGSGPPLLMIPGAPADAGAFGAIAAQLADRYTVMTYDWRGSSRSPLDEPPGDLPGGLPMQVQGDDAAHLLAALDAGPAYVLGCSGGALTGLDLVAHHPERVATLVAHEPPAMNLLPDGEGWRSAFQDVEDSYRRDGAGPVFYGHLIGNGSDPFKLFIGYLIGGGVMIIGGLVEVVLGIAAEGKSLEEVARPLSAVRMAAVESAPDLRRRLRNDG